MNLKSSTINLVETYLNIIIKRKLNQNSLSIAAKSFLAAAVAAISAPSFVDLAIATIHLLNNKARNSNAASNVILEDSFHVYAFFILISISIIFFILSHIYSKTKNDDIVQIKSLVGDFRVKNSIISCYVGSILNIYEADVVVTSEDTGLDMGSITGTSVSGRLRRMASSRDASGDIASDNLKNFVDSWKSSRGKYANFELGTSVVCEDSFEAKNHNIKCIILAVAIRKKEDNTAEIEESAISKIVYDALIETVRQGYHSIFIPVFGLGSGRIPSSRAISFTVNAVKTHLPKFNEEIRLYIGIYREEDKVDLLLKLRAMQRELQ